MSTVGALEKATQKRLVALFQKTLGYAYLGNWIDRPGNLTIEAERLEAWLTKRGVASAQRSRALHALTTAAGNASQSLYDRNRGVYELLRYGAQVRSEVAATTETVALIDWAHPEKNDFAVAEEVTVLGADAKAAEKRPDLVVYVNGIALAVIELKRSSVSVSEGIRQNLDNQKPMFIQPFFATIQWVVAGNDTQGLRYGTIETPEKHYLTWREDAPAAEDGTDNPLDRAVRQLFDQRRFLEMVHDFVVYDAGWKKLCRHNQYFGVKAAQDFIRRREGGIIWHTRGSGKSLTMVWLARWIRENVTDARVLIITDRTELDEQIEKVFLGVGEQIRRTSSGADLVACLDATTPWLLCSLVHKFGARTDGEGATAAEFAAEMQKALPPDFKPKGDLYIFVDECHRTQSGDLHKAMKVIVPNALFIGFTGTPLLKTDKKTSREVFGRFIHTYKFDEAVRDEVVLDLRYEARDIDQRLTSQAKVDQWFESNTKGLSDLGRAQLKARWGTMQKVLSSKSRLEKIRDDILMDMLRRDRLASGRGNAMLVTSSIYEACKVFELFQSTPLQGKCAIVTSYAPTAASVKGEATGEGLTERLKQYDIYVSMLATWFNEPPEKARNRAEDFEKAVKKKFNDEPAQMKLLIVVDKLLTGFDAPPASYLYIDKQMRDHGLFQAICRVNRLDGDDKRYGYVIDYKDLFKSLEGAIQDYTGGALDGYDREDVSGLLKDRLGAGRKRLDEALEAIRALCEPVALPRDQEAFLRFFCGVDPADVQQSKDTEPRRLKLYTLVAELVRAYADIASELTEAGYSAVEAARVKADVAWFEQLRSEVKLRSGDALDLKRYEPAMRHLIDAYIQANDSEVVSDLADLSLVEAIVSRGADAAIAALPAGLRKTQKSAAETIEANVRRLIVQEMPINPKYYEQMSALLDALIEQRRNEAIDYKTYLQKVVDLTKKAKTGPTAADYPKSLDTKAKRALFDNFGRDETLAVRIHDTLEANRQDDWRDHPARLRRMRLALRSALASTPLGSDAADRVLEIAQKQDEY